MVNQFYKGKIISRKSSDGYMLNQLSVPVLICHPNSDKCHMTDLIVDTGADRSMISYRFGIELGLEAPGEKDITKIVKTADNRDVHYIERKVDLHIGEKLDLNNFKICWCSKPGVNYNFLGMDILSSLKLILVKKEFYLVDPDHCVGCKK